MEKSDMDQCFYDYAQEMTMSTLDDSAMLYLEDSKEDLDLWTQMAMIQKN
jgi:hypothetical protein